MIHTKFARPTIIKMGETEHMQMVPSATEITEKIMQDIPIEDITCVRGMIFFGWGNNIQAYIKHCGSLERCF